jgi:prepilin-type N-terminal cleavage/methylation domain-containing protein/prepilin-type processing-associated H-X9-DG protein
LHRRAFTLIELLVVIAIVAILAAILFPVFAQAKLAAKKTVDLSNLKQVGTAYTMYANDFDDRFPLTTMNMSGLVMEMRPRASWVLQCQPYLKSYALLRSPVDASAFWPANGERWPDLAADPMDPRWSRYRTTSYLLNGYTAGDYEGGAYSTSSGFAAPANAIVLALSRDDVAPRDHFHPFYWGTPPERASMMMGPMVWDAAKSETKELKLNAFGDGANYAYADGHARYARWSQLWWRDVPNGVYAGSFDPRNVGRSN